MELIKTNYFLEKDLLKTNFDIVIASTGFESRASYFIQKFNINAELKICFGFTEYSDNIVRKNNDAVFLASEFEIILESGNSGKGVLEFLSSRALQKDNSEINILVDYSCMTRVWYSAILKFFRYIESSKKIVNIYFSYSFSKFIKPPTEIAYNKYVGPLDGFYSITIPSKPSALIIGLGYIQERAYGLAEFFDVEPYVFLSDSSVNVDYFNEVCENNKNLLSSIKSDNIFYYPLSNLKYAETLLSQLIKDLLDDFRIILAPSGPKPFTLISLLAAFRFENVDVWRISAGEEELPTNKEASGSFSFFHATFK